MNRTRFYYLDLLRVSLLCWCSIIILRFAFGLPVDGITYRRETTPALTQSCSQHLWALTNPILWSFLFLSLPPLDALFF